MRFFILIFLLFISPKAYAAEVNAGGGAFSSYKNYVEQTNILCDPVCGQKAQTLSGATLEKPEHYLNSGSRSPFHDATGRTTHPASGKAPANESWINKMPAAQQTAVINAAIEPSIIETKKALSHYLRSNAAGKNPLLTRLNNGTIHELVANLENLSLPEIKTVIGTGIILPFYIVVQWQAAHDLDIHFTGPNAAGSRFHVYHLDRGSLSSAPYAALLNDCTSQNCGEVIQVENLSEAGIYRASVHNFANPDQTSTELSTTSGVSIKIVRGGETVLEGRPTPNLAGNTWQAIEIDSAANQINLVNRITNSATPADVQ
jgi:hypothetical protein